MKTYSCFLNEELYGKGNLEYMLELFKDHVVTCKMYGKSEVTFKIVENAYPYFNGYATSNKYFNVDENAGQFEEDIIKIRLGIESVEEEKN